MERCLQADEHHSLWRNHLWINHLSIYQTSRAMELSFLSFGSQTLYFNYKEDIHIALIQTFNWRQSYCFKQSIPLFKLKSLKRRNFKIRMFWSIVLNWYTRQGKWKVILVSISVICLQRRQRRKPCKLVGDLPHGIVILWRSHFVHRKGLLVR